MRAYDRDPLVGRAAENRRVATLLDGARAGRGGALLLTGEAGIGKSALLDHAAEAAEGFRVARATGSEFEQELPFAGLHQLCVPILGSLNVIPEPHREALRVAFGLATGVPDLLRTGLAALELATAAARDAPLLLLVDDAQWLDPASTRALAFLARRVAADPIAVLVAARVPGTPGELDTLPALAVDGLSDDSAGELLAARSPLPLDERVRDRLVAEANGNPLALLELPRAGGFAPPETSSVPTLIERGFQARLTGLPDEARLLLTVASADPTGDPGLLWPAARTLGIDVSRAGAEAAGTGLAEFGTRVRFCHPLARSAVYRAAPPAEVRAAHGALAEATDPVVAPDRRAWHRAQACGGPDDDVADDLERSASRAQARGGVAAAAVFLERAAALTLDTGRRIARTLDAAQAHIDAGDTDAAADLLNTIDAAVLDERRLARVDVLRGRIAFIRSDGDTGPALMVRAAHRLSASDPDRARECFLDAVEMGLVVGRAGGLIEKIMATVRAEAPPPTSPDVLDALTVLATEGHHAAVPLLRAALATPLWSRRPALASMIAGEIYDMETLAALADWLVRTGRESGSPTMLRLGLAQKVVGATLTGDIGQALAVTAEEEAVAEATGGTPLIYHRLHLAAHRGRRDEMLTLIEAATQGPARVTNVHWTTSVLHNGLADYPAALAAARRGVEDGELFLSGAVLPELIEAAVRCDEPDLAARGLDALTVRAEASGIPAALGLAAAARGLLTGVEDHYREAIELFEESPLVPYRARAHLLYGEWLRRRNRRRDCLVHLRTAYELLTAAGADGFARRAATELRATGERALPRATGPAHETLTMQEIAVARLVASGAMSKDVAVQLFISKRTVDAHLRTIFRKLGITSRAQLRDHPGLA
ncbi:DNA-binding CsgD family transcriptional regulator [Catenuloplanes nepalensis]|uniref:DNA-binding CsgD family transcriptional regulator n=1 Tax=Catenuloplanes nepalensis TaxID=587533 RepID=A0ABT9N6W1_9ACTN|nr:LuxR family transcriptional regulator [Catenuloplanes nepalensis]MDP9799437.1 DNA-binding CsgD family transcriptional regulator [Catenuloplanes nepalensis]